MIRSARTFLYLLILFFSVQLFVPVQQALGQQATIPGDLPDPSVIRAGHRYYATGTSSEWAPHFPIFASADLKNWKQTGYVFDHTPEWISGSFWAPEYFFHNNQYYIYYTARRKADGISCIGVATSKYPDRGFIDHGVIIAWGKEAIDPFVFNDKGQLYITWKAYGLDNRPIEILGSKLSADGFSLVGAPFSVLKDDERVGLEGQSILKKDSYYYVFSSVGDCCGRGCSYRVRVARAKSITGPYETYKDNPVLTGNDAWKCTGHGTFVITPEGKYFYLYHAYSKTTGVYTGRQALLTELTWPVKNGWPRFKPLPAEPSKPVTLTDSFTGGMPAKAWQWDFRNASPVVKQRNGTLHLSGTVKQGNQAGVALTRRPYTINYTMQVSVLNTNAAVKGLVIYGDAGSAVGIGITGDTVELWQVKDNKRSILKSAMAAAGAVRLKLAVSPDFTCRAYWKQAVDWKELGADRPVSVNDLIPWDRSPRPGLIFSGDALSEAVFVDFSLEFRP